jgi:hypothetical protein
MILISPKNLIHFLFLLLLLQRARQQKFRKHSSLRLIVQTRVVLSAQIH